MKMQHSAFMQAIKKVHPTPDGLAVAIFALTEDTDTDKCYEILGEVGSVMMLDDGRIGIGIMPSKEANNV